MVIIAIDPGASGGIAIWDKGIKSLYKCPQDVEKMADIVNNSVNGSWINGDGQSIAYIEQVHAFPTDARSSAFKFGTNYGKWLGILGAKKIKTILVSPQKWMKYYQKKFKFKLPKDKTKRKRRLKELAADYTDKTVTLYNADAILIAMYGVHEQQERKNEKEESA